MTVPAFFVPNDDGTPREAADARHTYDKCREEAERKTGKKALGAPVYRLRFVYSERTDELVATVGKPDPYGHGQAVVAIVPFEDHFWICSPTPNHVVGSGAERHVEHFAQPAP